MKKLLKWVFPAFLAIIPVMGMDTKDAINAVNDDESFLRHASAKYKINGAYEKDGDVIAVVEKKIKGNEAEIREIKAKIGKKFCEWKWFEDSDKPYGQKTVKIFVETAKGKKKKKLTLEKHFEYKIVSKQPETVYYFNQNEILESELPLGETVEVCRKIKCIRPDKEKTPITVVYPFRKAIATAYKKENKPLEVKNLWKKLKEDVPVNVYAINANNCSEPLSNAIYQIVLKEVTKETPNMFVCENEYNKKINPLTTQQRHLTQTYTLFDTQKVINKIVGNQETLLLEGTTTKTKKKVGGLNDIRNCEGKNKFNDYTLIN